MLNAALPSAIATRRGSRCACMLFSVERQSLTVGLPFEKLNRISIHLCSLKCDCLCKAHVCSIFRQGIQCEWLVCMSHLGGECSILVHSGGFCGTQGYLYIIIIIWIFVWIFSSAPARFPMVPPAFLCVPHVYIIESARRPKYKNGDKPLVLICLL